MRTTPDHLIPNPIIPTIINQLSDGTRVVYSDTGQLSLAEWPPRTDELLPPSTPSEDQSE